MHKMLNIMFLALLVSLTGCSWWEDPQEALKTFTPKSDPNVKVLAVEVTEETADGVALLIKLELTNANDVGLPLPEAIYRVNIAGVGSFSGTGSPHATVPEGEKQYISLPAAISKNGSGSIVGASFTTSGTIDFQPPGRAWQWAVDEGWDILPSTSFNGSGTVSQGEMKKQPATTQPGDSSDS